MLTYKHDEWAVDRPRPNPRNARTHPKKQIVALSNSIKHFGWTAPIAVDETGEIIAGHARLAAAKLLGLNTVPVVIITGLTDAQKRAVALADNKIALSAGFDRAILSAELGELTTLLSELGLDIQTTGFEMAEVDGLLGDLVDREADPADEVPSLSQHAVTALGDTWRLGDHRLGCGDATIAKYVRALMCSTRAAMVFTDPPYNLRIASALGRGKIRHREFAAASGEMTPKQYTTFLFKAFKELAAVSKPGSIHFVFGDWRHIRETLDAGERVYGPLKNLVVWNKTNAGQGSLYRSQHELVFVFKNGDAPHINNVQLGQYGRNRSNVWTYAGINTFRAGRMDDLAVHPTVKPVSLVADAMRDCSGRGDIVLDPFMGSGTTILAAERIGRRAYGLEIDPLYVDVAIRRWQAFTRRDAILESTGQTFAEIAEAKAVSAGGCP